MPEPLLVWRANWVALALWRVAQGEANWVPVHTGEGRGGWGVRSQGRTDCPAFLPVRVPDLPGAGIAAHDLRLWRDQYRTFIRGCSLGERMALEAYLGRGRASRLAYWHAPSGQFRLNFPEDVVGVFVRLAALAESLARTQENP